ncbi:MAG: aminotransferase class I/II-fold pyridoxal phosphate-dependent enzyme, partial [Verrucomicrobiae bacterium]|nr:aminotransferase class I/II-fold pyridoxal phosphate-dependent enzyme [Verrucomicrobiae bacterium]
MRLSSRLDDVQPSLTLSISAKAARYRSEGRDVIALSAGEPDFPPPAAVEEAAIDAVRTHRGLYTPVQGTDGLRRAIAHRMETAQGLRYGPESIIVTSGAKQALFNAIYAMCDEGDEILIPAPYWTSYPEMARALAVTPVLVPMDADLRLDLDAIARSITPRTRAIILNSPSNPTGAVLSREELEGVADLVRRHDLLVLSDDIYERLIFDGSDFLNLPMVAPDLKDRTVLVNGLSKTYCMTGWRIGYAAG